MTEYGISSAVRKNMVAHYHLPGLFEFYELYRIFLHIYREHREYFYPWCDIASVYGSPENCLWGGGRVGVSDERAEDVLELMHEYGISPRLTFSNSLLREKHLADEKCNRLCALFEKENGGVIVHSDLLADYIKKTYPKLYLISSTTKVLTEFNDFRTELNRNEFLFTVPDFRLNKAFGKLKNLNQTEKDRVEFLCNECCYPGCKDRRACYENVSRLNLGEDVPDFICRAPKGSEGYRFSSAMKNPMFIGTDDILNTYLPMGFTNFKVEGRTLGSAVVLEFLLYYLIRPEYHINVREHIYLDSMLDLF